MRTNFPGGITAHRTRNSFASVHDPGMLQDFNDRTAESGLSSNYLAAAAACN